MNIKMYPSQLWVEEVYINFKQSYNIACYLCYTFYNKEIKYIQTKFWVYVMIVFMRLLK